MTDTPSSIFSSPKPKTHALMFLLECWHIRRHCAPREICCTDVALVDTLVSTVCLAIHKEPKSIWQSMRSAGTLRFRETEYQAAKRRGRVPVKIIGFLTGGVIASRILSPFILLKARSQRPGRCRPEL